MSLFCGLVNFCLKASINTLLSLYIWFHHGCMCKEWYFLHSFVKLVLNWEVLHFWHNSPPSDDPDADLNCVCKPCTVTWIYICVNLMQKCHSALRFHETVIPNQGLNSAMVYNMISFRWHINSSLFYISLFAICSHRLNFVWDLTTLTMKRCDVM